MELLEGKYTANGDKNVYVKILGEGGIPVVIETGWGCLSIEWENIQTELSKFTTVISYDRPGYAESPISSNARNSAQVAEDLLNTLLNTGIQGPYILLGHGGGGLYVQHFAKLFSTYTAGMVLVDSFTENEREFDKLDAPKYLEIMSHETKLNNFRQYAEMEKEDFEGMISPLLSELYKHYPEHLSHAMISYQSDHSFYKTILNEMEAMDENIEMIKQMSIFTNIPVIVLCRDFEVMINLSKHFGIPENEGRLAEELWLRNSQTLTNLSTDSEMKIVKGASHNIHIDKPDAIVEAVLEVMRKAELD